MNKAHLFHPDADRLAAYPRGKLDQAEKAEITRHLADCADCRAVVEAVARETINAQSEPGTVPPKPSTQHTNRGERKTTDGQPATVGLPDDMSSARDTADPKSSGTGGKVLSKEFGHYRIIKLLGRGAMGAVYLAQDKRLDRAVALKVPRFRAEDDPQVLERFYQEAKAAATIEHPNICPVYEVGEFQGIRFMAMRYLQGKPLSETLIGGVKLPQRPAAALTYKLAQALQVAHARGVIHRDLKPSNVMLVNGRDPVIMDFGLARRTNSQDARLTQTGIVMGTPAYMAPEQAAGQTENAGPAADVYSLGVILYEMLTGKIPFEGPVATVLGKIMSAEPTAPSILRPDLDRSLEAICLKAMAKQPTNRHGSMGDFASALGAFLRQGGKTAEKDSSANIFQGETGTTELTAASAPGYYQLVSEQGKVENAITKSAPDADSRLTDSKLSTVRRNKKASDDKGRKKRKSGMSPRLWFAAGAGVAALITGVGLLVVVLTRPIATAESDPQARTVKESAVQPISNSDRDDPIKKTALAAIRDKPEIPSVPGRQSNPAQAVDAKVEESNAFAAIYHFDPNQAVNEPSRNVRVYQEDNGQMHTSVLGDDGTIGTLKVGPGTISFVPDVLGSTGLHVVANRKLGFTTVAGLKFTQDAVINIWTDGVIEADAAGLQATGVDGVRYVSRQMMFRNRNAIVMVRVDGRPAEPFKKADAGAMPVAKRPRVRNPGQAAPFNPLPPPVVRSAVPKNDLGNVERVTLNEMHVLRGHTGSVSCLAFSPGSGKLATGSDDTTVKLWDPASGKLVHTLRGHASPVQALAFANAKLLASASVSRLYVDVKLWHTTTGKNQGLFEWMDYGAPTVAHSLTFSPDGKTLAAGGSGLVRLWSMATGKEKAIFKWPSTTSGHVYSLAFAPDGKTLASICTSPQEPAKLWNVVKVTQQATLLETKRTTNQGFNDGRGVIAYAADGKTLAMATANGVNRTSGTLTLWNTIPGKELTTMRATHDIPGGGYFAVSILPGGNIWVAAAIGPSQQSQLDESATEVRLWDLASNLTRILSTKHLNKVVCLGFSPDGKLLATGSDDQTIKIWDLAKMKQAGKAVN